MVDSDLNDRISEVPPPFKTWRGWYTLVLSVLCALILLFYLLGRIFR